MSDRISIHAPARGATGSLEVVKSGGIISIHAPARGATPVYRHALEGEKISIHAPARGATKLSPYRLQGYLYFNPRSREGSDPQN